MRKALILQGWYQKPDQHWYPWLKKELEKRGYKVSAPQMPSLGKPKIKPWVNKIKKTVKNNENVLFIGHSIGCQAILRYFEALKDDKRVARVVLIAPWINLSKKIIEEEGEEVWEIARPWMETPINWKKVKRHCNSFISIFSGDDPYVPLSNANLFKKNLNAQIIILKKKGHFREDDNIKKLPEILQFIR